MKQEAHQRQASPELLVHEIPDDEIGYDADVEILRPDAYEEPESETSEDAKSSTEAEEHRRNELVKHMKLLSCDTDARNNSNSGDSRRGRKRRSKDAFGTPAAQMSTVLSEGQIEVTEFVDEREVRSRFKRVRRRSRRSKTKDGLIGKPPDSESGLGKNGQGKGDSMAPQNESCTTDLSLQEHLDELMDLD